MNQNSILNSNIPEGILLINTVKHEDHRGYFSETFNQKKNIQFANLNFVQDNQSLSVQKYVFRGLHYQSPPFAQDKLIRVLRGTILDIVFDLRRSSKTFGKYASFEISSLKFNQILVPKGFAHGFLTLEENTEVFYKVTDYYSPKHDFGINIFDKDLNIKLPVENNKIILSQKDLNLPKFMKDNYYFD
jgi:dTDP-4-dehydrorhamnose 3,5-epimerase